MDNCIGFPIGTSVPLGFNMLTGAVGGIVYWMLGENREQHALAHGSSARELSITQAAGAGLTEIGQAQGHRHQRCAEIRA